MIIGSSLAALARAQGAALVRPGRDRRRRRGAALGVCEAAADWTFVGSTFWASSLGFMIWVLVTATYLVSAAAVGTHGMLPARPARRATSRSAASRPGAPSARACRRRLEQMAGERIEVPLVIGGKDVTTGETRPAVMPHDTRARARRRPPGRRRARRSRRSTPRPTAWKDWSRWPWEERAAVFLRAAELLAGPWRDTLNAATMLGQSKTAHQAEIDAACELIDFLRFNVEFMTRIYAEQPHLVAGHLEPARVPAARGLRASRSRRSTSPRSPAT